jgi:Tfp pilus assembly protein PilX
MARQPAMGHFRRALRRLQSTVRDERGITLVLALLITTALTITTASLALLVTSNEHAFGRDRQETLAFNTAEAGLNYAVSYLSQTTDPNGSAPIGTQEPAQGTYSPYTDNAPAGAHSFSNSGTPAGTFSGKWWAEKLDTHQWKIWASGTSPNNQVIRELQTKVVSKTVPGTVTPASLAWSYGLFVANPGGCFSPQGTADLTISIYVNGDICIGGSAGVQEPSTSTGGTIEVYSTGKVSVTGSASIGTSAKHIAKLTANNGCTDGSGKKASICTTSNTTNVWANTHVSGAQSLTKPTLVPASVYAQADWKNGPVCTGSAPVFDNNSTRNTSAPSPNLTPGSSYDCTIYATSAHTGTPVGTLSWNAATQKLSASGTIFFDSDLNWSNGASSYTTGTSATFYFNGTITINGNSAFCGPPATPSGSSCTGTWDTHQGAIVFAAINAANASPAWKANGNAEYDVAAYVVGLYQNNGTAKVVGPVITDQANVSGTGSSSDVLDPPPTSPGASHTDPGATTWGIIPGTWAQVKPS